MAVPHRDPDPLHSQRSRLGAYALHAAYDSRELTKPARRAFLARFEREVDPDGVLDPAERIRRATYARKAYMARLNLRSAEVRRKRAAEREAQGLPPTLEDPEVLARLVRLLAEALRGAK